MAFLTVATPTSVVFARLWTDATGRHRVEADLVESDDQKVVLKRAGGKLVTIPVEKLSDADREFVKTAKPSLPVEPPASASESSVKTSTPNSIKETGKTPPTDSLPVLAERAKKSVVLIEAGDGFGSGFVIDAEGIVATNYHVIEGASRASVTFQDGTSFEAAGYVAFNRGRDLALLRIYPKTKLQALLLASELPKALEAVIAIGAPKGLTFTSTRGDVSAVRKGKEIRQSFLATVGADIYHESMGYDDDATWIQTTVPISGGNSGGPLIDMQGHVVGANTWTRLQGQSLNFAISAIEITSLMRVATKQPQGFASLPRPINHGPVAQPGIANAPGLQPRRELRIVFPSGRAINSGTFAVDMNSVTQWLDVAYKRSNGTAPVIFLRHANGSLFAVASHINGTLNGATLAFYENKDPMVYATYEKGYRHGILKTWDVLGNNAYWCQYVRGKRHGFCCLFKDNRMRMVLECSLGKTDAVHLITEDQVVKSFATMELALLDETAKSALNDLDDVEAKLLASELEFKKVVKKEDGRQRQARAARATRESREGSLSRIDQHSQERNEVMRSIKRASGAFAPR